jgi:hypothetical protein
MVLRVRLALRLPNRIKDIGSVCHGRSDRDRQKLKGLLMPLLPPWAYIDPVSGSILLQVIAAGVIGAIGYFFRPLWRFARLLLNRKRNGEVQSRKRDAEDEKKP